MGFEGTLSSNRVTGFVFDLYTGWVLTVPSYLDVGLDSVGLQR